MKGQYQCGSTDTHNGMDCRVSTQKRGDRCKRHRERKHRKKFSRDWVAWLRAIAQPDGMGYRIPVSLNLLADELEAAGA